MCQVSGFRIEVRVGFGVRIRIRVRVRVRMRMRVRGRYLLGVSRNLVIEILCVIALNGGMVIRGEGGMKKD